MRISDWSSDVCSSDLELRRPRRPTGIGAATSGYGEPCPARPIFRMTDMLVLRPEPGARETAERARQRGLGAVTTPLLSIRPVAWEPLAPETVGAVMLTRVNAARSGGKALAMFSHLPCSAAGAQTESG